MIQICFVTGWVNVKDHLPLILASNRDEFYERGGIDPDLRESEDYSYLAPQDPRAGGTWLGINKAGLVVALTNRPGEETATDRPSRGRLVRELLSGAGSLPVAKERLAGEDLSAYNPFSLVALASEGLYYLRLDENDEVEETTREECCFFLSNQMKLEVYPPEARDRFPWGGHGEETNVERLRGRLQNFCRQHHGFKDHVNLCRHGEESGTVSSSIILLSLESDQLIYDYAPGPPCKKRYKSVPVPEDFNREVINGW